MKIGENGQVTSAMYLAIEVYFVFEGKELVIFNKLLKEKKKVHFQSLKLPWLWIHWILSLCLIIFFSHEINDHLFILVPKRCPIVYRIKYIPSSPF